MRRRGRPQGPLTPREHELLDYSRAGQTNPDVGERLGISAETVKQHSPQVLAELAVTTREQAAAALTDELEPTRPRSLGSVALVIGGAALMLVAASGLGILIWGTAESGSGETVAVIEPTPSRTAAAVVATPRRTAASILPPAAFTASPTTSPTPTLKPAPTLRPRPIAPPPPAEEPAEIVEPTPEPVTPPLTPEPTPPPEPETPAPTDTPPANLNARAHSITNPDPDHVTPAQRSWRPARRVLNPP